MTVATAVTDFDAGLMLRVREGDDESFALLLHKHRAPLVSFLNRMVQNRAQAEELAQETFLRVYRQRARYEPTAKFTTWLFCIAVNLAINARRDQRRALQPEPLETDFPDGRARQVADRRANVEEHLLEQARLEEIRRAVAELPARQRAAVLMHKYEEMTYAQIAGALDCSETAVKSLLFRAYETLRGRLGHLV